VSKTSESKTSSPHLKVILVADEKLKLANLEQALVSQNHLLVARLENTDFLYKQAQRHQADVIIIDNSNASKTQFDAISQLAIEAPTPVVMFSMSDDVTNIALAVQAGVHAYEFDDLNEHKLNSVIHLAKARFVHTQALKDELQQVKDQLEERKVIEKAKGMIMKSQGCDEPAAYKALRNLAMDRSQRIFDVAKNVISVMDLMKTV